MQSYEREVFAGIDVMSVYGKYTDKYDYPRRDIIHSALPDQLIRAAFMSTWKAGATWKSHRKQAITEGLWAIDIAKAVHPAMRIKRPTASQAEKLEYLGMLVESINEEGGFKSEHQYGALKAILNTQATGDIAALHVAGMNLYGWAGETC